MDVADWAAATGSRASRSPAGRARRRGPPLRRHLPHRRRRPVARPRPREIADEIEAKGLEISGLGYYPNPLHPDPAVREAAIAHLKAVIVAAGRMGVPFVNTFMGGDATKHVDANWEEALECLAGDRHASRNDHGVRITIENCPMIFSYDEWPAGHNIAWSPYIWRRIIEEWGDTIGLNYDPSHLVWLMIDQGRFIREFGPHILHFQAKDVHDRPRRPVRARHAVVAASAGRSRACRAWARPTGGASSPTSTASATTATCIIEHEDRGFEGTDELVKRGFLLARDILRPYIK